MKSPITVACLVAASTLLAFIGWVQLSDMSPQLTRNLGGGSWTALSERFNARLERAFPIGSSEMKMLAELRRQGFVILPAGTVVEREREAVRREDNFVCNIAARVYWHADTSARIVAIRGVYREEGCL